MTYRPGIDATAIARRHLGIIGQARITVAAVALIAGSVLLADLPASADAATTAVATATPAHVTTISLNGNNPGAQYQGIGAISGGGGNSRLLIDYPAAQREQILDYLFKPGYGAALQILKLEIGGDANSSDGSEPSVEHAAGKINCSAGYEFWLARQAKAINPALRLYGLQWAAPGWVGNGRQTVWTAQDIRYLIDWMNCARSWGLTINYIGGWNERGYGAGIGGPAWFEGLRAALNAAGYQGTQIVAADTSAKFNGTDIADALTADPAFRAAVAIVGYHDSCQYPTTGITCTVPATATTLGKPVWQSEIGKMDSNMDAPAMVRSINNAYIQAGVTALIHWPVMDSMPPDLPMENRGLVWADQPWSGNYAVNLMTWAIAQTTQFVWPGWQHIDGANGALGTAAWGTYNSYEGPAHSIWSMVVQTTTATAPQSVVVHLGGHLARTVVHVWSTIMSPRDHAGWFVHDPDVHPVRGTFSYVLRPGYVYTFTTSAGQGKGTAAPPLSVPLPFPYTARPDASNEPWALAAQDGAFEYAGDHTTIEQTADQVPVFWEPVTARRSPYAVVGGGSWQDYTVSATVSFTAPGQRAGLIARFSRTKWGSAPQQYYGYQFMVAADGTWQLMRNAGPADPVALASGSVAALGTGTWNTLTLAVHGTFLAASINSSRVATAAATAYVEGPAGIATGGWYRVRFRDLRVTA